MWLCKGDEIEKNKVGDWPKNLLLYEIDLHVPVANVYAIDTLKIGLFVTLKWVSANKQVPKKCTIIT